MPDPDDDGVLIGRIVIERRLRRDDDLVSAVADDGQGGRLAAVVVLGMLRLAESLALDDLDNLSPDGDDDAGQP